MPHRSTLKGKRDYAMLSLLLGCVLRRAELVGLDVTDLQMRENRWVLAGLLIYDFGPQLYDSGQYSIVSGLFAPTFSLGSYHLRDGGAGFETLNGAFDLTISAAPNTPTSVTPEPPSLYLLLTGLLAAVVIMLRRLLSSRPAQV